MTKVSEVTLTAYIDRRLAVDESGVTIRGIPLPKLSRVTLTWNEISRIEERPIGFLRRMWLMGPSTPTTWWAFDPARALKGRALMIHLLEGIGPFSCIGVTVNHMELALAAFEAHAPNLLSKQE